MAVTEASCIALALSLLTSAAPAIEKGNAVTALYSFDRQRMPYIDAVEYTLRDETPHIFSVPVKNSVGTNAYRNGITILDLSGTRVQYRQVRRNFVDEVDAGEQVFLPQFSSEWIGYSQTRGFLLFNVKTGEFKDQIVPRRLELTIQDVAVLDWEKRLFLFSLDFTPGFDGSQTWLWAVDLSGPEPKRLATFEIEQEPLWPELGKTTFYFSRNGERKLLHALDERLQAVEHPLLAVYNAHGGRKKADLPCVHPTLPLAVFTAEDNAPARTLYVWAAVWSDRRKPPLLYKLGEGLLGGFRFSPDGRWLWFRHRIIDSGDRWPVRSTLAYVVIPVDRDVPHFLGPPILLRSKEEQPDDWNGNCAWISDPPAVVCRVQKSEKIWLTGEYKQVTKLLKWDLSPASVRK
jgi:hypothetical protein